MCIGHEQTNLCACGCPEIVHDEPTILDSMVAAEFGWGEAARGKCRGSKLSLVSKDGRPDHASLDECDCTTFRPLFKNMCGGF
jgi:hypothetical protein